jgi:hypothetical protein
MHSLVTKITTVRSARRARQAEQIHAVWEDRRRHSDAVYVFPAHIRWAV